MQTPTPSILLYFILVISLSFSSKLPSKEQPTGKFLGAINTKYPGWFKDSFLELAEDLDETNAAGKRLILFFYQDGCPYCNAMIEKNFSQKNIRDKIQKNFEVIALHLRGDREITYFNDQQYSEKELAKALKIQFTPTLLFYDEKANVIQRLNGYHPPARFSVELDYIALHKEKEITARDYLKKNYHSKQSNKNLFSQDFFTDPPFDLVKWKKSSTQPLAVFFEQKDCPDCEKLHKHVLSDPDTRKIISQFKVIQLDMWSNTPITNPFGKQKTAKEWAKELNINFAPSIILFNLEGKEIIRLEAEFKIFHTQTIFNYVLSEKYKTESDFQRYLTDRSNALRKKGIDVDISK